jgi:hypothetical protein
MVPFLPRPTATRSAPARTGAGRGRRFAVLCALLPAVMLATACGGDPPAGSGDGSGNGSGTGSTAGSGTEAKAGYAVKADLCAEADLAPLKALFPVVDQLKAEQRSFNGAPSFFCNGNASKSTSYDDIGFFTMAAYSFGSAADATRQYESATSSSKTDKQPVPGVGQQALSYADGPGAIKVSAVDGPFYFQVGWSSNSAAIPAELSPQVRQALVATAQATMAKLKTT